MAWDEKCNPGYGRGALYIIHPGWHAGCNQAGMRSTIIGSYSVLHLRDDRFQVVHTWNGIALGTYPNLEAAIRHARQSQEDDWTYRHFGKEAALESARRRNGYPPDGV
jgi:hypothetical protein